MTNKYDNPLDFDFYDSENLASKGFKIYLDKNKMPHKECINIILFKKHNKMKQQIMQMIENKLHGNNNKDMLAEKIESIIINSISNRSPLLYDFKTSNIIHPYKIYFDNNDLGVLYNWILSTLTIPLYHSLGDTIGYHDGKWEFNNWTDNITPDYVNTMIYEYMELGGIVDMSIDNWKSSDDTIMYIATMKTLLQTDVTEPDILNIEDNIPDKFRNNYLSIQNLMENRHPGVATMNSLNTQKVISWNQLPYDNKVIGAGSAMRSGFIGALLQNNDNKSIDNLLKLSIVSSLITHNSTIAILGSIVSALFTSFSIQKISINKWPHKLLKLIRSDMIDNILKNIKPDEYKYYQRDRIVYIGQWEKYISLFFNGLEPRTDLKFMKNPVERYRYLTDNFSKGCKIPGSCGDDCLIMAYDSILRCNGSIEKLLLYSILHPGDSDTVGSIAFGWFCGYYNSPRIENLVYPMLEKLEYRNIIKKYQPFFMIDLIFYFFDVIAVSIYTRTIDKYANITA